MKGLVSLERLYDKLFNYSKEDYYPMHMPGHKRNTKEFTMVNPYAIDITEIDGFDNLHQAEGVIEELSVRISRLYKAGKSYPLVNGSTAGILTGISAATKRGDRILIARNSHKSVYHAAAIMDLKPVYINPEIVDQLPINGGILPEKIEELLIKYQDIKLVVITSPTYEGAVSDIKRIASVVHGHGALLLVDEAHGAHFGFHEAFPKSAVTLGADIVIQSLHKTLPAFTQTAILHSNRPELNNRLSQYLAIYESSSPSYLLMAGIDRCISLLEDKANNLFRDYIDKLNKFYASMQSLKNLKLVDRQMIGFNGVYDLDPSKLTICVKNTKLTGHKLGEILREKYHIVVEMEAKDYVLGMTSICDSEEGFNRLEHALHNIDQEVLPERSDPEFTDIGEMKPVQAMTLSRAMDLTTERIKFADSSGRISAAFISLFPPGSPILAPGERIEEGLISYLENAKQEGLTITGFLGDNKDEIEVIADMQ